MSWWKLAYLVSGIWILCTIGAGLVHTHLISAETLTDTERVSLAQFYALGCVVGVAATWIVYFVRSRLARS
jgi:hypothetical protein